MATQTSPLPVPGVQPHPRRRPLRVFMLDLASIVPYYTGHLSAALAESGVALRLGAITYHLDPGYFRRAGLRPRPGLLDVVSRLKIGSPALRHGLKTIEYLGNCLATLLRGAIERPDLAHVQFLPLVKTGLPFEVWMLRAWRRTGAKLVYTVHNVLPQDTGERHRDRYAALYGLMDRLICHDQSARERLTREFGIAPERISVIPHGPLFQGGATTGVSAARARLGFPPERCVVLCQGIIRRYKGVDLLLDAWRQAVQTGVAATLVVAGSGEEELLREIRARVAEYGIGDSVRLELRFVSAEELDELYAAADILVYPYREITTSGALMTGICRGKAIAASRLPAFERLLRHGESAWLVEPNDAGDLAAALSRLIGDPELRQRLGRGAYEAWNAGPQWPDIARQTQAVYASALSGQTE